MPLGEKSALHVEGADDQHAIKHLLGRHDSDCSDIDFKESDGKDALLRSIDTAVRASTDRSVGFVLDADEFSENRWLAVRGRLDGVGLTLPENIPEEGFVGDATKYGTRVGVWLMPDNRRAGALEDFLSDLVDSEDPLFPHAQTSTAVARDKGAVFAEVSRPKAVIHTWLAWQESPGLPYGSAINARFFRHDSRAAMGFVDWFRRVFSL